MLPHVEDVHKYLCSMCVSCRENLESCDLFLGVFFLFSATQGSLEIAFEVSMVVTKHLITY